MKETEQAKALYSKGIAAEASGDLDAALDAYAAALDAIPDPNYEYPIAVDILKRIGDIEFRKPDYAMARQVFRDAVSCRGGLGDEFVHLRLGQCAFEFGDMERAGDELARAYMGGGREIFDGENPKYLAFLNTILLPPAGQTEL